MSIAEGGAVFMEKFGIRTTQCGACPSSASVHPCSTLVLSHCAGATKLGSSTTKVSKQAMVVLTNATKAAALSLPDANSDGKISHAEVRHAGAVLAALDTNQDGKVSTSEVKQAVTAAAATAATSVTAATAADEPDANHEDTAAAAASEGSSVKDASTGAASVELAQVPAADRIAPRGCLNGCVGSSGPARVTERGPPPENEWAGPDHKSEGEQTSSARASHEGGLGGGVDMDIDGRGRFGPAPILRAPWGDIVDMPEESWQSNPHQVARQVTWQVTCQVACQVTGQVTCQVTCQVTW